MSNTLIFRKNNQTLLSFSDVSRIYELMSPYTLFDEWVDCTESDIIRAKVNCDYNVNTYKQQIKVYERMLSAKLSFEDAFETSRAIQEIEEIIEEYNYAKITLDVLNLLLDECDNSDKFQFTLC